MKNLTKPKCVACILLVLMQYINVNANTPIADIFYDLNQVPVTTAGAIIDATGNTSGTLSNTVNGMPTLIQGASSYSQGLGFQPDR